MCVVNEGMPAFPKRIISHLNDHAIVFHRKCLLTRERKEKGMKKKKLNGQEKGGFPLPRFVPTKETRRYHKFPGHQAFYDPQLPMYGAAS